MERLGKAWMTHLRLWLFVCLGWCILWIPSAQASWEFYQQAGEEAYSRGDYATARQMFLAAVREARELGPQESAPGYQSPPPGPVTWRTQRTEPGRGAGPADDQENIAGAPAQPGTSWSPAARRALGGAAYQVGTSTPWPAFGASYRAPQGYTSHAHAPSVQNRAPCGPASAAWQAA